jgi:hypothetical protein
MKKNVSIVFVLTAYCILLLHSVIPHHHHEAFARHHETYSADNNENDHNFLGHAFSLLQHDNAATIVYESVSPSFKCTKVKFNTDIIFHEAPGAGVIHKPPLIYPDHAVFRFNAPFADILQLRGPPVPMA